MSSPPPLSYRQQDGHERLLADCRRYWPLARASAGMCLVCVWLLPFLVWTTPESKVGAIVLAIACLSAIVFIVAHTMAIPVRRRVRKVISNLALALFAWSVFCFLLAVVILSIGPGVALWGFLALPFLFTRPLSNAARSPNPPELLFPTLDP